MCNLPECRINYTRSFLGTKVRCWEQQALNRRGIVLWHLARNSYYIYSTAYICLQRLLTRLYGRIGLNSIIRLRVQPEEKAKRPYNYVEEPIISTDQIYCLSQYHFESLGQSLQIIIST